jgi:hypothetical protein
MGEKNSSVNPTNFTIFKKLQKKLCSKLKIKCWQVCWGKWHLVLLVEKIFLPRLKSHPKSKI